MISLETILEHKKQRDEMLIYLYSYAYLHGDNITLFDLYTGLEQPSASVLTNVKYLNGLGFVNYTDGRLVSINYYGMKYVEEKLSCSKND